MTNLTPMMQQYLNIKNNHRDAILFFRMGDFYEMFFEDAELASKVLGITLTSRERKKENAIPMCGVPHHAAPTYINKLVKEGCKVALCEQIEEAGTGKNIVKREVTRVVTPGIPFDEGLLEASNNNYLSSVFISKSKLGLAFIDITTGEFKLTELEGTKELLIEISRMEPKEVLLSEQLKNSSLVEEITGIMPVVLFTYIDERRFEQQSAEKYLLEQYGVSTLDGFGCDGLKEGLRAAGALLYYVREIQKRESVHIKVPLTYGNKDYMSIDSNSLRNLELLCLIRDKNKRGSLLAILDKTKTASGGRKLKEYLLFPLMDVTEIKRRQDAIGALLEGRVDREDMQARLEGFYDLERIVSKVSMSRANPRDLVALKGSLRRIPDIKNLLHNYNNGSLLKEIADGLDDLKEVTALIDSAIVDEPPLNFKEGGFIRPAYNQELDEIRNLRKNGKEWITCLEREEKEKTGISSLKVRYNRVFGYYIEVTKANLSSVPDNYIRKQTLVNAERFITPGLKEYEDKVLRAQERIVSLEQALFQNVRDVVSSYCSKIQETGAYIGVLDSLLSLSQVADESNYSRPDVMNDTRIEIHDGRHPVIESLSSDGFVPNDTTIDNENNQIIILTGPNMAGKSTYMRQVALIVVMAQMGSYVPAAKAEIGIVDRVFTRIGAVDDISKGQSTFMVEMSEVSEILHYATPRSLIILDEVGRGTSTFDGVSIAWAIAEFIHDHPFLKAKTLFATHYHELTELSLTKERVKNYNILIKEWDDQIIFLRKVVKGGANRSYGIQVARLAGLPKEILERAREILHNLEGDELDESGLPRIASSPILKRVQKQSPQLNLFVKSNELDKNIDMLRRELEQTDLNSMTPMEAINKLDYLKKLISS